jgi:carnosine N-methyltransferase
MHHHHGELQCNRDDDDEERRHFQQVCNSYQQYATFHQVREQGRNHRRERLLSSMCAVEEGPTTESLLQKLLSQQQQKKNNELFCQATIRNQYFLDNVLKHCGAMTSQEVIRHKNAGAEVEWATEDQLSKIDSVLKSVFRDWSMEGRDERMIVYDKLLGALEKYLPIRKSDAEINDSSDDLKNDNCNDRGPPRVAVPGSGLGRLAFEIYSKGYSCQGSDFSLPMLLASDFILNGCGGRQYAISPFLSETKNVKSLQDRLRTVVVPDITAVKLSNEGELAPDFTMLAGEFLSLYSHFLPGNRCVDDEKQAKFNAVVCSFFIDTAPSLPHYLITIWHMLENGGLFVNMGPLMWHWSGYGDVIPEDLNETTSNVEGDFISAKHKQRAVHLDQRYLQSVDFTWEEVKDLIVNCGFEILEEEFDIRTMYTSDTSSMKSVNYDCIFFVARKVVP